MGGVDSVDDEHDASGEECEGQDFIHKMVGRKRSGGRFLPGDHGSDDSPDGDVGCRPAQESFAAVSRSQLNATRTVAGIPFTRMNRSKAIKSSTSIGPI